MIYPQARKNSRSRTGRRVIAACLAFAIIGAGAQYFRPSFFPSVVTTLVRPFWRAELSMQSGSMQSPAELLQQNQNLQRLLDDADVRLQTIKSVEDENTELKSLMGRASSTPYVLAAVLRRPPLSAYDELIIDAGSDNGLLPGNNVYAAGDVLIGRISQVLGQTSKVILFSSPGQTYNVLIGSGHASATAFGRGGGQYEAELPRDIKVSEGDFVIAPSLDGRPFGIVKTVLSDPAQPFEKILFAPPVNVYDLRWVLVDPKIRLI